MTLSKSDSTSCSYGVFVLPAVKFVLGRSFLFLRWHPKFTLWNHLTALNLNLQTNQALTLESVNVFQWWGSSALPAVRLRWSCLIVLDIVGDDCTSIGARFLSTTARPMGGNLVPVGQDHQKGRLAVTRLWWSFPRHPRRSKRSSDLLLPAAACQSAAHPAITLHVLFYPCCLPWPVLGLLLQFLPGIRKPSFCCFFLSWLPHFDFARVFSINSSFLKFFFFLWKWSVFVSVSGLTWRSTRSPELWVESSPLHHRCSPSFWPFHVCPFAPTGLFCLKSPGPSGYLRIKKETRRLWTFFAFFLLSFQPVLCDAQTFPLAPPAGLGSNQPAASRTLVLHIILYSVKIIFIVLVSTFTM